MGRSLGRHQNRVARTEAGSSVGHSRTGEGVRGPLRTCSETQRCLTYRGQPLDTLQQAPV
jgi:hypothetical protein